MHNLCQLTELKLSCFGCCGHSYKSKEKIMRDLEKNSLEYEFCKDNREFRDRAKRNDLRPSGICRNIIIAGDSVICPLHPELNDMLDLRITHCNTMHLCRTRREFESWDEDKRNAYLRFLKGKNLDMIDYSIKTDDGSLLREFQTLSESRQNI